MLARLFSKKEVIDENTRQWIFDTMSWSISSFNAQVFKHETQLILPTNEFYPGKVKSIEEMANNIFVRTAEYAGMENWPIKLVRPQQLIHREIPIFSMSADFRGKSAVVDKDNAPSSPIQLTYNSLQINQPQDLIASYANQLATILFLTRKVLPPGGKAFIPQAIDVLSCAMGFGVIFSNTAYQFKGGCGSCNNPRANREVALPENEMLYALAVFSQLKDIENKLITPHLKPHLRRLFKNMRKDVAQNSSGLPAITLLN